MANDLLTPVAVTREALRILHQKLNFVGSVHRDYDSSFAKDGAKIGDSLKIRLPNQYVVHTGATMGTQDTEEKSTTLQVSTQKHVPVSFTSAELTLSLDDFSDRILKPAMSVLAANIEADALSMYADVYNEVSDVGAAMTFADVSNSRKALTDSLAPYDMRCLILNTQANSDMVDALKGFYNDQNRVSKNYREGRVADNFLGYSKVYENTLLPIHTTGSDDGTGDYRINGANQTGDTLTIDSGTGTWKKGDVFYINNVRSVHPETKEATGRLQRFVVTADAAANATSLSISPAIVTAGGRQNVTAGPADNAQLFKRESDNTTAIGNAADYEISLGFHKDAFAFATADLQMPDGVDFAAREVMDGISMRVVRQYNISSDAFPCRIDVLYGYKTIRPELACRIGTN